MTTPEVRPVMLEIFAAIASKPEVEVKLGTPPRNPNIRSVIKTLTDLGEFETAEAQDKEI